MAQIPHHGSPLRLRHVPQLPSAEADAAGIGQLAEERLAQGGFAAGYRAGDADDLSGLRCKADVPEHLPAAGIGKAQIGYRQLRRRGGGQLRLLLHLFQQRLHPPPGDLGLLDGVKELRRLGGLDGQLRKAGQKRREGGDVPAGPARPGHVFAAQPQNEHRAQHGHHLVQRRQGVLPQVCRRGLFLVVRKALAVGPVPVCLQAKHPVGHGAGDALQRGPVQPPRALLIHRRTPGDGLFHPLRQEERHRGEQSRQQRQPPVVDQQQHKVRRQRHAGVKHLRGEFPHSLHAGVHIGDGPGHQVARARPLQLLPGGVEQIAVQHPLHAAIHIIGKAADVKALEIPGGLDERRHAHVQRRQIRHGGPLSRAAHDVQQALGQLALQHRAEGQTDVVHQSRHRHHRQRPRFRLEICQQPVRLPPLAHASPSVSSSRAMTWGKPSRRSCLERAYSRCSSRAKVCRSSAVSSSSSQS